MNSKTTYESSSSLLCDAKRPCPPTPPLSPDDTSPAASDGERLGLPLLWTGFLRQRHYMWISGRDDSSDALRLRCTSDTSSGCTH